MRPFGCTAGWGYESWVLTCKTSASLGLLVGSHQKLRCRRERRRLSRVRDARSLATIGSVELHSTEMILSDRREQAVEFSVTKERIEFVSRYVHHQPDLNR